LLIYIKEQGLIKIKSISLDQEIPENTVWIDLVNITQDEENKLEEYFNIDIPTHEETRNISVSNRLYEKQNAIFMTITIYLSQDGNLCNLEAHNISFVIVKGILITIRDIDSNIFDSLLHSVEPKHISLENVCFALMIILLEKIINDTAAFLENIGHNLDQQNENIINPAPTNDSNKINYKTLLKEITNIGSSVSKTSESLIIFNRMLTFLSQSDLIKSQENHINHIKIFLKDIDALRSHTSFLSNKISFLLDATLGLINIEQNNIIKIFSVVSVIFMPPTLIASIYGMNFDIIPELNWVGGYPFAIIMMLISSWIPYKYFKKQKWL
jgi:magnesium transporter